MSKRKIYCEKNTYIIISIIFYCRVSADVGNNVRHGSSFSSSSYGSSGFKGEFGLNQLIAIRITMILFLLDVIYLVYMWCKDSNKVKKAYNPNIKNMLMKSDPLFDEEVFLN